MVFLTHRCREADRNRRFDDHDGIRVVLDNQLDNGFDSRGVEEVLLAVVVGRCSDDNKICILISRFRIQRCNEIQVFFCKVLFDVFVLNRRLLLVDEVDFFRDNIHRHNLIML